MAVSHFGPRLHCLLQLLQLTVILTTSATELNKHPEVSKGEFDVVSAPVNSILTGHVFRIVSRRSALHCAASCLQNPTCKSFNFCKEIKRCEINSMTASDHPEDLRTGKGCQCYELKPTCREPLGMENGAIPDSSLSVSSVYDPNLESNKYYVKGNARLNMDATWCARNEDSSPWIQVDLQETATVTGLVTQGNPRGGDFTKTYQVKFSNNGIAWDFVTGTGGSPMVFQGNTEATKKTGKTNYFPVAIKMRYIRILPKTSIFSKCLRFELLGCRD